MKEYLDLLKDVLENGHSHPDRTKVGRRSVFGRQIRFDMKKGFPLVTTRKIHTPAMFHELVWFLMGTSKIDYLIENNVKIWDKWVVNKETIDEYYESVVKPNILAWYETIITNTKEEDRETIDGVTFEERAAKERDSMLTGVYEQINDKYLNSVGPIYGPKWRHAKVENMAFEPFNQIVDPLKDLITNLRKRPFSSRHVINTWDVKTLADETISPRDNVLNGKGALAPCHVLQQYFVKEIDGQKYLSLQLYQRKH